MKMSNRRARKDRRSTRRSNPGKPGYACETLESRMLLTGSWSALVNPVPTYRPGFLDGANVMMLLSDGSVMVHGSTNFIQNGGTPGSFYNVSSAAWYKLSPQGNDYHDGTWSTLASMNVPRKFFGANVLPSGKVFVVGGEYTLDGASPPNEIQTFVSSSEIYNPLTNTWTNAANFNTTGHSQFGDDPTAMLDGGKVLAGYLNGPQTYLYDSNNDSWSATGTKVNNGGFSDQSDEESWVKLPDGSILSYDVFSSALTNTGHAQRYVPSTGQWSDTGNLPFLLTSGALGSELGPAFLLPDRRAWFTGANGNTAFYTPATDTWAAGPVIPGGNGATDDPGAMLPNGKVLLAVSPIGALNSAGNYNFPAATKVYEFDPLQASNPVTHGYSDVTPTIAGFNPSQNAYQMAMLVLPNGHVLMSNDTGTVLEYTPDGLFQAAWQPVISNITNDNGSNVFTLSGY
ncbi:MAG: hypothetical protein JWN24_4684 [Phycisphaerales bacterium]|nr:hypothetical protein [Phycisphaerales bacterium]